LSENALVGLISGDYGCLKKQCDQFDHPVSQSQVRDFDRASEPGPFSETLRTVLFDMETYVLKPHSPAVYSTIRLNVTYDPTATCPQWEEAIKTIIDNEESIGVVQEFFDCA